MNAITPTEPGTYVLDLDVFDSLTRNMGLHRDDLRAKAMGIHPSSVSKIRSGKVRPGRKFIEGAASIGIPFSAIFVRKQAS